MIDREHSCVTCDVCGRPEGIDAAREEGWDLDWENGYSECADCVELRLEESLT